MNLTKKINNFLSKWLSIKTYRAEFGVFNILLVMCILLIGVRLNHLFLSAAESQNNSDNQKTEGSKLTGQDKSAGSIEAKKPDPKKASGEKKEGSKTQPPKGDEKLKESKDNDKKTEEKGKVTEQSKSSQPIEQPLSKNLPNVTSTKIDEKKGSETIDEKKKEEAFKQLQNLSPESLNILQELKNRSDELDKRDKELQAEKLINQKFNEEISKKVVELKKLRDEIQKTIDVQNKVTKENVASLIKIYESMKPKEAAPIFNKLDFEILLQIVQGMNKKKTASIMALMDVDRVKVLSQVLAKPKELVAPPPPPTLPPALLNPSA